MYGVVKGMKAVRAAVNEYILMECKENGVLSDVAEVITTQRVENPVTPPFIWIYKLMTVPYDDMKGNRTQYLKSSYQLICGYYDEDLGIGEENAEDLTYRAVACIQKHFNSKRIPYFEDRPYERIFTSNGLQVSTIYPVGDVEVRGKSDRVPCCAVDIDFIHRIDWNLCKRL